MTAKDYKRNVNIVNISKSLILNLNYYISQRMSSWEGRILVHILAADFYRHLHKNQHVPLVRLYLKIYIKK